MANIDTVKTNTSPAEQFDYEMLASNGLFRGIEKNEIKNIALSCGMFSREHEKGTLLLGRGDRVLNIGIIASGHCEAARYDVGGKRFIVTELKKGDAFGDVLSANTELRSPVDIEAISRVKAYYIPFDRVINGEVSIQLLRNFLGIISEKYFGLHRRIELLILPTLEDKILSYLNSEAEKAGSRSFDVSLGRTGMAEYLNADRSALSRELAKMKKEGKVNYHKNSFTLLAKQGEEL